MSYNAIVQPVVDYGLSLRSQGPEEFRVNK